MLNFQESLKKNPLVTKQDIENALIQLVSPVYKQMALDKTPGRVHLSDSGSVYSEDKREIEGFLRTLWGVGPLFSQKQAINQYSDLFEQVCQGITTGVDPNSSNYWGKLEDYDQLFVEMGALASFIIFTKEFFWDTLQKTEQTAIYHWLNQINQHTIPKTNWLFFRVLVNTCFEVVNCPTTNQSIELDLSAIERFYLDDGWYFDGYKDQIDYYIPFGMQYYSLLYTYFTPNSEGSFIKKYRERGAIFANTFKQWFVKQGAALPFGRSLTYRFAQSSYFAVAALAQVDYSGFTKSEGKYLLLQNMRYWFQQPIFTLEGTLSIGYGYPNLNMAEGYNAPGSPYWALKNFCILALPDDDPFWNLEEKEPTFSTKELNIHSKMLLVHDQDGKELQAFTAGQHSHEHAHGDAKYEKFVYSTTFGFSVPKGRVLPKQGAYDNTLAISENGTHFQTPFGYESYAVTPDYIYSSWHPYEDVYIDSYIIPFYPWHLRYHIIKTKRTLQLINGSFSAPADGTLLNVASSKGIYYQSSVGIVGIKSFSPNLDCSLTIPEPNTNLLYNRTVIPQATLSLSPGTHHYLLGCLGNAHSSLIPEIDAKIYEGNLKITGEKDSTIFLNH
jgi:hypothetical protein